MLMTKLLRQILNCVRRLRLSQIGLVVRLIYEGAPLLVQKCSCSVASLLVRVVQLVARETVGIQSARVSIRRRLLSLAN